MKEIVAVTNIVVKTGGEVVWRPPRLVCFLPVVLSAVQEKPGVLAVVTDLEEAV